MVRKRVTIIFLSAMTLIALYSCYLLIQPFLNPLLSAAVIAVVFYPIHSQIQRRLKSPSLAALVSTIIVVLVIVVPTVAVALALKEEIAGLVNLISEKTTESGGVSPYISHLLERPIQWIGRYIDLSQIDLRASALERLRELSAFLVAEGWLIVGGLTSFILNSVIAIFALFFIFREGRSARRRIAALLPLSSEQVEKLFSGIESTIIGTVYGGLVVAAVQGALTGLALWVLGVPSPVLWGVVAAFFALLPVIGTAAVWAPAAVYLLATGAWVKAIILVVWGAFVVGTVDNILRPYLISGRVQMHTLLIFFAVFGGVTMFGFLGLFIGPVILAVTITLLSILRDESRTWNWREDPAGADEAAEVQESE